MNNNPQTQSTNSNSQFDQTLQLERWQDEDVKLLIATWSDNKHRFGGKATKKMIFDKIAEQFKAKSSKTVTGEQCLRKWAKLCQKYKDIEDYNSQSGNDSKTWKYHPYLQDALAKDPTVKPVFTMETGQVETENPNPNPVAGAGDSDEDSEEESFEDNTSTCESTSGSSTVPGPSRAKAKGRRTSSNLAATATGNAMNRCRKRPKSRSSASEMLDFLKDYGEKRDKVEEQKLGLMREMKEQKEEFFNRFFDFMSQRKN